MSRRERERERELGERVALEAGSEDAIIIAKERKDASVKEKMPGLKKKKGWANNLSICSKNLSFHLDLIHIRAHHMFLHQYPIYKKQKITISTYKLQLEYLVMQPHSFDYLKHSPQIFNYWPIQKL